MPPITKTDSSANTAPAINPARTAPREGNRPKLLPSRKGASLQSGLPTTCVARELTVEPSSDAIRPPDVAASLPNIVADGEHASENPVDAPAIHIRHGFDAMLRCKPAGHFENEAAARLRLRKVCDLAIAYDMSKGVATTALIEYEKRFPFDTKFWQSLELHDCIALAEERTPRGAALRPLNAVVAVGPADAAGKRQVRVTRGAQSFTDRFDPREDARLQRFATRVCEKFRTCWAEQEIYDAVRLQTDDGVAATVQKFEIGALIERFPQRRPAVIAGLGREGETINFVSHSKVGKSWTACQLGLSIAMGTPWLGLFGTAPGRVLFVDNELSADELAHRQRVIAAAMGIDLAALEGRVQVWSLRHHPLSLDELQPDFDELEPGAYKLIVLDAIYKFLPPGVSENDNAAIAQFHGRVTALAARLGALVAMVHHASKGPQEGKRLTDIGAGAGAQSRAADCHLVLRDHDQPGVLVLDGVLRSFAPMKPVTLRIEFPLLVPVEGLDPHRLRIEETAGERRQQAKDADGFAAITTALKSGKKATARQLRQLTSLGASRLGRLLDIMVHDGALTATAVTVRGNTTQEYSL